MPNLSAKELLELASKLRNEGITQDQIAKEANKSERYIRMVFSPNDPRYSEDVIRIAKRLLVEKSTEEFTQAFKRHNDVMKVL
ncbi:hypothetical protein [Reichenbachiella sp.]|uniref:hypothetical protein n=1 Tax=Reichenbachiella sp. TaxID=2184521 RepID=UPI003B5A4FA4